MADSTTRYSFPYQEASDAPNGPALGQDLAEAVEVSLGTVDDRVTVLEAEDVARVLRAIKTADEGPVVSNVTPQNDDHLFVSVAANSRYIVQGWIRYVAESATPDLRINYTYPAGATFARNDFGTAFTAGTVAAEAVDMTTQTTADNGRGAGTAERGLIVLGYLSTGGTAGTFRVTWAQLTSSADDLFVKAGSWIRLEKV